MQPWSLKQQKKKLKENVVIYIPNANQKSSLSFDAGDIPVFESRSVILLVGVFKMKFVEESMKDGCDNNGDDNKKYNATKKGIETGKYLAFICLQS